MNTTLQQISDNELIHAFIERKLFDEDFTNYFYTFDSATFEAKYLILEKELNSAPPTGLNPADLKAWKGARGTRVGKAFEDLCGSLLKMTSVLSYHSNIRTEISEIDFFIQKSDQIKANLFDVFRISNGFILGEAKCYAGNKFDGDWLIKIRGRMDQHNINLAILFVSCEKEKLEGKTYKNFLINSAQNKFIIPIGKQCLTRLRKGENFIKLLSDQYDGLKSFNAIAV